LLVFVSAFIGQWGIGAIVNLWPVGAEGYAAKGYQMAFGLFLVLQLVAFGWFLAGRDEKR
jgi:hypothetical protein